MGGIQEFGDALNRHLVRPSLVIVGVLLAVGVGGTTWAAVSEWTNLEMPILPAGAAAAGTLGAWVWYFGLHKQD